MYRLFLPLILLLCVVSLLHAQLPKIDPPRQWKTDAGQAFTATLLSFDGKVAIFKMPAGNQAQAPVEKLSEADRAYLFDWQKRQPIRVVMPEVAGVEPSAIQATVVSEDDATERFVYRTQHFEFESQGKFSVSLLREVARTFEGTYELLKALPWGIDPRPPTGTHFKAKLLKNREEYVKAGGIPNSGGIYKSSTETFYAPFESIGLKPFGKGYTKDADFKADTLVHELTHQMMHFWLDYLPQWVVEGSAEYTENLPLRAGKFRVVAAKSGLKDYTEFLKKRALGGMPEPYPIEKLFRITNAEWNETMIQDPTLVRRMYFTSYLLVYYFMHMDGAGDGQRFVRFFREVDSVRKVGQRTNFEEDSDLQNQMLSVLLDGRTEEQLMEEIRAAYARLGIRL